jgi:hypothetical protein
MPDTKARALKALGMQTDAFDYLAERMIEEAKEKFLIGLLLVALKERLHEPYWDKIMVLLAHHWLTPESGSTGDLLEALTTALESQEARNG